MNIVLPLGGKASPLSLLINVFIYTARRAVARPPSPERKITRPVKHKDTISLGPSVLIKEAGIKVKCLQEEDKRPTCRRTWTHVYTSAHAHTCTHMHACTWTRPPPPCTGSARHTSTYTLTRARVCASSATSVRACTHRRPACTCSCMHTLPLNSTRTHADVCTHGPCCLEARGAAQVAPELRGLGGYRLSVGEGPPPGTGLEDAGQQRSLKPGLCPA